ncbi:MAG TPA: hypothetical protein DIW07_09355 [Lachnospiraceae bacterium]|nr:hypothetical protein [Lachnospiraceae bacterium]
MNIVSVVNAIFKRPRIFYSGYLLVLSKVHGDDVVIAQCMCFSQNGVINSEPNGNANISAWLIAGGNKKN